MKPSNGSDEFKTTNLDFSAFLMTSGYNFIRLEGPAGERVFVFAGVPDNAMQEFLGGEKVEARRLLMNLRDLKGLLMQGGRR